MNIKITPKPLKGQIDSITSKSHAHRLLIAAALCDHPCQVNIKDMNKDLDATINCLSQFDDTEPVLDCKESGSTLRFMLPIAMALKNKVTFLGSGRLPARPLSPLKEEMSSHGCAFTKSQRFAAPPSTEICTITGTLRGGTIPLPGNVSSQYITGLLFALPLLMEDSTIVITSPLESQGYVMLTLEVLRLFGIEITMQQNNPAALSESAVCSFFVKGNQKYDSPGEVTAEGDWSNGAFWLVAGALGHDVFCLNLRSDSLQGDKEIVTFINAVGRAQNSEKLLFDAAQVPDLVPILAVLAASRQGTTEIVHAGRLRIKESDRLATIREMLEALGGKVDELPEGLVIYGKGALKGGTVNGHNDHRIVMAAAIASIICHDPVTILGAEAADKSYPKFFEDFQKLGGDYHVL